jgi:hypothetical protein
MNTRISLIILTAFALAACGDNSQQKMAQQIEAQQQQIAQQQAQLQAMQQQIQQDDTVYQLTPQAVADTIPAEFQQGNNGEPVTGTDGQQYMYDASTGSWLLYSLVGAAAGAFIGNSLANKFQRAPAGNAAAQRVRTQYYQAQPHRGNPVQTPNTLREQPKSQANNPNYRQVQKAPANQRAPVRRNGFRRR